MLAMFAFRIMLILILILAFIIISNVMFERRKQKRKWNNGYCPECNGQWLLLEKYNNENRYVCKNNKTHRCIITYEDIDKKREEG